MHYDTMHKVHSQPLTNILQVTFVSQQKLCFLTSPNMETGQTTRRNTMEIEVIKTNTNYEENNPPTGSEEAKPEIDYSKRAQWLRAAVLGANDGLITTASLMMGVGAVKQDVRAMVLTGFAGLVAAACSMAIGEFVSVYSQLDIEVAQRKREKKKDKDEDEDEDEESLPSPIQAAFASALAVAVGAFVPLLAAMFIKDHKVRLGVVPAAVTVALVVFGWLGAYLGNAPVLRGSVRVLLGGWFAMGITFGLTKLIGSHGL